MRHGLTVIILTRNEKKNIEDCIASVKFADDIIIVDSGSEDNTRDIAQKCGARVFLKPFENFAAQRNFGLSKVGGFSVRRKGSSCKGNGGGCF